ncbi:hypothetical protein CANMA_005115 [Candida margitis]|uniref:uncharacterized protein n=1 Tax=Candida margitis TaxID=1775924 RepID=UPI0022280AEA|nr:uncharacterized protein CANMA_005115 [Candida margitis]KAI5952128.1 hypothetical protein CANMA_005115 [Candida margitis]
MSSSGIVSSKGASVFFGISAYFQNSAGNGVQSVQVIIAPIFIAASVYVSLGGLLKKLEIFKVGFNRKFQSFLFIIGDITFGLQIAGVVLQMIEDNKALGQGLVIGGFVLQIISFCCFIALVALAHRKVNNTALQSKMTGFHSWRTYFKVLYAVIVLFFIRNIFRLIEYAQGFGGYIFDHAVFAYIFDSVPMLIVCTLLAIVHPGFVYSKVRGFMVEANGLQPDKRMDQSSIELE